MASNQENFDRQLQKLVAKQCETLETVKALESRMDVLHQELQRTNTTIYRMGLSQESAKHSLQRQEKALTDLSAQIVSVLLAAGVSK